MRNLVIVSNTNSCEALSCLILILLGTAKLNGLNPAEWLKDTLEKLPAWPNSRIDELLPLAIDDIDVIKQKLPERAKW